MIVVLCIGTCLGGTTFNIKKAIEEIGKIAQIIKTSSLYITAPCELPCSNFFLNFGIVCETDMDIDTLWSHLLNIEKTMKKETIIPHKQVRPIDIDVLVCYPLRQKSKHIEIPHPAIKKRKFLWHILKELHPYGHVPVCNRYN